MSRWYSRGYLPHFDSPHVLQHITYRLVDALPRAILGKYKKEVEHLFPDSRQQKNELRRRIEAYLDAGHGSCVLVKPEIAACIADTWFRFDGKRYRLLEWVIMPNHCHVLIEPFKNIPLAKTVLSWKNYTARFINTYSGRPGTVFSPQSVSEGRKAGHGNVWQRDYWDRFIRDERHFAAARTYINENPVKAGLVAKAENWPWGSAAMRASYPG